MPYTKQLCALTSAMVLSCTSYAAPKLFPSKADKLGFKRNSVSVGVLYVKPQGNPNTFRNSTAIAEGTNTSVGEVKSQSVLDAVDTRTADGQAKKTILQTAVQADGLVAQLNNGSGLITFNRDGDQFLRPNIAGTATLNGLSQWENDAGLMADEVITLGLVTNYYFTDNISFMLVGGFPPKVDVLGKGKVVAPLTGQAQVAGINSGLSNIPLKKDILVTDLEAVNATSSARAWTPAFAMQYQFGKTGKNKFRPFVGAGIMVGYFSELELDKKTEADLVLAGHRIQNIKDGRAGAALDDVNSSSAIPKVKLKSSTEVGPFVTAGYTYDLSPQWFTTASVSYAKLKTDVTINTINARNGELLTQGKTTLDIDPLLTYVGFGYRY